MDTIGKRLRFFLEKEGISTTKFAEKTGIPNTSVYRLLNGESGVNSTTLARLIEFYPTLDITWLITGNGNYTDLPRKENRINEEAEPYLTKNDADLKTKVRTILNNEVVLDAFIEILKRYDK